MSSFVFAGIVAYLGTTIPSQGWYITLQVKVDLVTAQGTVECRDVLPQFQQVQL